MSNQSAIANLNPYAKGVLWVIMVLLVGLSIHVFAWGFCKLHNEWNYPLTVMTQKGIVFSLAVALSGSTFIDFIFSNYEPQKWISTLIVSCFFLNMILAALSVFLIENIDQSALNTEVLHTLQIGTFIYTLIYSGVFRTAIFKKP
jgi:hypothetical protein